VRTELTINSNRPSIRGAGVVARHNCEMPIIHCTTMKTSLLLCLFVAVSVVRSPAAPLGSAFTYSGRQENTTLQQRLEKLERLLQRLAGE
jgi:hypothetical protein